MKSSGPVRIYMLMMIIEFNRLSSSSWFFNIIISTKVFGGAVETNGSSYHRHFSEKAENLEVFCLLYVYSVLYYEIKVSESTFTFMQDSMMNLSKDR